MPTFDIIRQVKPKKTFRVASIMGTFDLQTENIIERFKGEIKMPKQWQIGLIVGNSGTGKTTIARELFKDAYITNFDYSAESVLDDMPKDCSVEQIAKTFNSVGFSSPPSWLKPYSVLSNGEKMRCDLARAILSNNDLFVFDEFTSVVDRNVAKIGSFAMQKAIRKTNKKFIAVSCHFDIEDWLLPDWVFDTNTMTFRENEKQKKNRPNIKFKIYETKDKSRYWKMFSRYHYLSHSHNNAARVFIATLNDEICGFCSVLPFPHPKLKNHWKEHRTVILPDFQGIGIGHLLSNNVAEILKANGKGFISTSSNPALINARKNDKKWIVTRVGRMGSGSVNGKIQNKNKKGSTSCNRITVSFKYIG
jgi:ABC-type dipeptide/oligopeptide/nickel transport system ATPase subunit/GNAT superfamily N-acetyltransferase